MPKKDRLFEIHSNSTNADSDTYVYAILSNWVSCLTLINFSLGVLRQESDQAVQTVTETGQNHLYFIRH